MSQNHYAPCPCGSGNKIKFCCGDLATDIEHVGRLLEGDQRVAALRLLNQLLEKHPGRIALLDIKVGILFSLEKLEEARTTLEEILAQQPRHPAALGRKALLSVSEGNALEAVDYLQSACEASEKHPSRAVIESFLHVGVALERVGHILAAKAHYFFHVNSGAGDSGDTRSIMALAELDSQEGMPLLVKDRYIPRRCPDGVSWEQEYNEAFQLSVRGAWRLAAEKFNALLAKTDNAPEVVYSLAILNAWLGDVEAFVDGMRQYAKLEVPEDDAVEALAFANLLDHGRAEDMASRVRETFEVQDANALLEKLSEETSLFTVPEELHQPENEQEGEHVPPLATFLLLDRATEEDAKYSTRADVPEVLGLMQLFGRETDREARVEFYVVNNAQYNDAKKQLQSVVGFDCEKPTGVEHSGEVDRLYDAMSPRFHLPSTVPTTLQLALMREHRLHAIEHIWPTVPQHAMGGKTPAEASKDPALRIDLLAALLTFETTSLAAGAQEAISTLRENLGVEQTAPIDPTEGKFNPWEFPLVRVLKLQIDKLPDEQLVQLWRRAYMASADQVLTCTSREAVRRPGIREKISFKQAFHTLINHAHDVESAKEVIAEARIATKDEENSDACWDLAEFKLSMESGDEAGVQQMFDHFRAEHDDDPYVNAALKEIFSSMGMLPEQQAPANQAELEDPQQAAGGLWTPDSDQPTSSSEEKSAIWTP